jgi:hypothetical protein
MRWKNKGAKVIIPSMPFSGSLLCPGRFFFKAIFAQDPSIHDFFVLHVAQGWLLYILLE